MQPPKQVSNYLNSKARIYCSCQNIANNISFCRQICIASSHTSHYKLQIGTAKINVCGSGNISYIFYFTEWVARKENMMITIFIMDSSLSKSTEKKDLNVFYATKYSQMIREANEVEIAFGKCNCSA